MIASTFTLTTLLVGQLTGGFVFNRIPRTTPKKIETVAPNKLDEKAVLKELENDAKCFERDGTQINPNRMVSTPIVYFIDSDIAKSYTALKVGKGESVLAQVFSVGDKYYLHVMHGGVLSYPTKEDVLVEIPTADLRRVEVDAYAKAVEEFRAPLTEKERVYSGQSHYLEEIEEAVNQLRQIYQSYLDTVSGVVVHINDEGSLVWNEKVLIQNYRELIANKSLRFQPVAYTLKDLRRGQSLTFNLNPKDER